MKRHFCSAPYLIALVLPSIVLAAPPYPYDFVHDSGRISPPENTTNFKFGSKLVSDGQRLGVLALTANLNLHKTFVMEKSDGQWLTFAVGEGNTLEIAIHGDLFVEGRELEEAAVVYWRDNAGTPGQPTDDSWPLMAQLVASDGHDGQDFGSRVSVSSDWIAVSAPGDDTECVTDPDCNAGAVYMYRRNDAGTPGDLSDDTWTQAQKLLPWADAGSGSRFGESIDLEGDWLAVGAPYNKHWQGSSGAVFMFRRYDHGTTDLSDDTWSAFQRLIINGVAGSYGFVGKNVVIGGSRVAATAGFSIDPAIFTFDLEGTWSQSGVAIHTGGVVQFKLHDDLLLATMDKLQGYYGGALRIYELDAWGTPQDQSDDHWVVRREAVSPFPLIQSTTYLEVVGDELLVSAPYDDAGCNYATQCNTGAVFQFSYDALLAEPPSSPLLPSNDFVGIQRKNRYISFAPNPAYAGQPVAYLVRRGYSQAQAFSVSVPLPATGLRAGEAITALVSDPYLIYQDTGAVDLFHVKGCLIQPQLKNTAFYYEVFATLDGMNLSQPLALYTTDPPGDNRQWGDVVGAKEIMDPSPTTPPTPLYDWRAPDNFVTGYDLTALVDTFQHATGSLHVTRGDLAPEFPDGVVNGVDILAAAKAFAVGTGREFYPFATLSQCPTPPSSAELMP
ncbi:MAG: FG-GAP repeat protein [Phycisphaerae bacterium]|nr:FG-GAP repeat protein [Phycisphaerae bacterium]